MLGVAFAVFLFFLFVYLSATVAMVLDYTP